ncbi:MAG: hypothetical protein PHU85_17420 [Phycisphaerae bacterium]|nr:hypothetical protein [Phycisphaerae bacterium]
MTTQPDNLNERLSAFLDGELPPDEAAQLEGRLAAEPALRLELEELAEVKRLVSQLPRAKAPVSVRLAIREQLERRSLLHGSGLAARAGLWIRFIRVATAAAMLTIVATVGYTVWRHVNIWPLSSPSEDSRLGAVPGDSPMEKLAKDGKLPEGLPADANPENVAVAPRPAAPDAPAVGGERLDVKEEAGRKDAGKAAIAEADGKTPADELKKQDVADRVSLAGKDKSLEDRAKERDASPMAVQLLRGSVTAGAVKNYAFEQEPVVVEVATNSVAEQRQMVSDVRKKLEENGVVPADQLKNTDKLTADDHQFLLEGKAGQNFKAADHEEKVFFRARRNVAEQVVAEVDKRSNGQARMQLRNSNAASADTTRQIREAEEIARDTLGQGKLDYPDAEVASAGGFGGGRGQSRSAAPGGPAGSMLGKGDGRVAVNAGQSTASRPDVAGQSPGVVIAVAPPPPPATPVSPARVTPLAPTADSMRPSASPAFAGPKAVAKFVDQPRRGPERADVPPATQPTVGAPIVVTAQPAKTPGDEPRLPSRFEKPAAAEPSTGTAAGVAATTQPDSQVAVKPSVEPKGQADADRGAAVQTLVGAPQQQAGQKREADQGWINMVINVYVSQERGGQGGQMQQQMRQQLDAAPATQPK